jgi:hypothetical protein
MENKESLCGGTVSSPPSYFRDLCRWALEEVPVLVAWDSLFFILHFSQVPQEKPGALQIFSED